MVSTKTVVVGLASAVGMMQMAPAPPVILGSILGGVVAGAIGGAATLCSRYCPGPKVRAAAVDIMARDLPPGVSQHALDECTGQLNDQKKKGITVSIVGDQNQDTIDVSNVPPACMDLATVLSGHPAQAGGPVPIPMGSDKLQYQKISPEDRQAIAKVLGA